jgi:hypothetical protein
MSFIEETPKNENLRVKGTSRISLFLCFFLSFILSFSLSLGLSLSFFLFFRSIVKISQHVKVETNIFREQVGQIRRTVQHFLKPHNIHNNDLGLERKTNFIPKRNLQRISAYITILDLTYFYCRRLQKMMLVDPKFENLRKILLCDILLWLIYDNVTSNIFVQGRM